jgi:hypothetical protein
VEAMRNSWTDDRLDALNEKVDLRFDSLDKKIDDRFDALDKKFDQKFESLRVEMRQGFAAVDARFEALHRTLIYVLVSSVTISIAAAALAANIFK